MFNYIEYKRQGMIKLQANNEGFLLTRNRVDVNTSKVIEITSEPYTLSGVDILIHRCKTHLKGLKQLKHDAKKLS